MPQSTVSKAVDLYVSASRERDELQATIDRVSWLCIKAERDGLPVATADLRAAILGQRQG